MLVERRQVDMDVFFLQGERVKVDHVQGWVPGSGYEPPDRVLH